ncbi:MAG: M13 family metallopeptidase [Bacteroidia bacterium]|nr:M13 family metallopeptidase [Bacteroidia bacterium]
MKINPVIYLKWLKLIYYNSVLSIIKSVIVALTWIVMTGCSNETSKDVNTKTKDAESEPVLDIGYIDESVDPGDDFYNYTNANWIKNNPVPEQFNRYSSFEKLYDNNMKQMRELLENAMNSKDTKDPLFQKLGDFYSSGMDTVKIEADEIKPLKDDFDRIDAIKDIKGFQDAAAFYQKRELWPLFYIFSGQDTKNSSMIIAQFHQGGMGLPDKDYYLSEDPHSKEIRKEYTGHIVKMFELTGEEKAQSEKDAAVVIKIETQMARASLTLLEQRDPNSIYHKMTLPGLQKLLPGFNWKSYFTMIGLPENTEINLRQPEFFKEINGMLKSVPVTEWKIYLRWVLINNAAEFISSDFANEHFRFFSAVMSGNKKMPERWKRVLKTTNTVMGEALGKMYVKKYFPPEARQRMMDMVKNLKLSLKDHIEGLDWMSVATKKEALAKLEAMTLKIGYPDTWKDYSNLNVQKDSYYNNVMHAYEFLFSEDMAKIGKPVDRTKWSMLPQTVNAAYQKGMNEIIFPAGILQPPFFDLNADDAVNYGAIGCVIGHEMTHGFDDQGRLFDKNGNLSNWWTKEDSLKFSEKTSALVKQYDNYKISDSLHINGRLTLGENIADLGGISISLSALTRVLKDEEIKKIDGFTPVQRFFIAYSQLWKLSILDKEQIRRLTQDVHSPSEARVNGIVYNIPDFYEAFGVKSGKRFKPGKDRVKVW